MKISDLQLPGLCPERVDILAALVSDEFSPREAAAAYIAAGYPWTDIPRAYQALVFAGRLPDVGMIWRIARIAFREQPENSGLREWAETLGPDNWRDARHAAAAADATYAYDAATYAYAAYATAYANAYAHAAYANAYATANAYAAANAYARNRVKDEIVEMILAEVERAWRA